MPSAITFWDWRHESKTLLIGIPDFFFLVYDAGGLLMAMLGQISRKRMEKNPNGAISNSHVDTFFYVVEDEVFMSVIKEAIYVLSAFLLVQKLIRCFSGSFCFMMKMNSSSAN